MTWRDQASTAQIGKEIRVFWLIHDLLLGMSFTQAQQADASSLRHLRCLGFRAPGKLLPIAALAMFVLHVHPALAENLAVETIRLLALRVDGQSARAHTQGMEISDGQYYVTARRDDVLPKRALLLRTNPVATDWDVWDITPVDAAGGVTALDHPGGMQSDGQRLWIPLAESKRKGRSMIRAFRIADMIPGRPLKSEFEFPVDDHIGAVAISTGRKLIFGANWDTEAVYLWDFEGRLLRTLNPSELGDRELGVVSGSVNRAGLAVQDWKMVDDRLFASGLFRPPSGIPASPQSRLMIFTDFLERGFQRRTITLPVQQKTELAHEAMAVSDGLVYFLPEDLGATNRAFRVSVADLMKQSTLKER